MKRYQFRDILRMFCKEHKIKIPEYEKRTKLFYAYRESLSTAPVPDDEDTLNQFLMNTNWTEIFMDKNNMCAVTTTNDITGSVKTNWFKLAPLPKAVPSIKAGYAGTPFQATGFYDVIQEEGKTPMRYNDNYASASANVITAQSDTAVQREYLLTRLARAEQPKSQEIYNLFNMDVDNTPKTFKELIDVIKNDKFSLDPKFVKKLDNLEEDQEPWYWGPMTGIIWDGPQPDQKGYSDGLEQKDKQYRNAKDIIMGGVYADGLKALQDFEAWTPVGKSN